jgi:hypothetical protein
LTSEQLAEALLEERPELKARAVARWIEARRRGEDLPCTRAELAALQEVMSVPLRLAARRERRRSRASAGAPASGRSAR